MAVLSRNPSSNNNDLVWDIAEFRQRKKAAIFVQSFENSFCVFSSTVNQLYTNYSIHFPEADPSNIIILPNQYCYHDTYNNIVEVAVKETKIQIVRDSKHLEPLIRIPYKAGNRVYHTFPLAIGLNFVRRNSPKDDPFLPVLAKGDLRELDLSTPYLQLHRISLLELGYMSVFERNGIKDTVSRKLRFIK